MKTKFNTRFKCVVAICGILTILLSSCATRTFVCKSVPDHALITSYIDTSLHVSSFTSTKGETPTNVKLQFLGKDSKYFLTAEKRGYYPFTKVVTKNSELANTFTLKKIEGASEALYPKENLKNATFYLLPPKINFEYHKGSGAFQRYDYDAGESKKIKENLVKDIAARNKSSLCVLNFDGKDACKAYKDSLPEAFFNYVFDLNDKRLNYYAYPPSIEPITTKFGNIREALQNHPSVSGHRYFVCVFAKCISQTAGRAVGQVFLTVASNSYVPTNDSGTTLNLCIIDAETLEVVHIYKTFYKENIAKPAELQKVNDGFSGYLFSL